MTIKYSIFNRGRNGLEAHLIAMHRDRNYIEKCDFCNKEFKSKNGLRNHKLTVHEGFNEKCDDCGQSLTSKRSLTRHKQRYHNPNWTSYKCDECGCKIASKNGLMKHLKVFHDYNDNQAQAVSLSVDDDKYSRMIKKSEML